MVGFLPIMTRRLYDEGMTTPSLLFWRYGIALVAIGIAARLVRLDLFRSGRGGAFRIALIGATLGSAQTLCFFESLRFLETGIAVLLFYTYPAVTLVLERVVFRHRVRPVAVLCVAMILTGPYRIADYAFDVKVVSYNAKGKSKPLAGASVNGVHTNRHGVAQIVAKQSGRLLLKATHAGYIRDEVRVLVSP